MRFIVIITLFLIGCSKGDPVLLKDSDKKYLGVWQHLHEIKDEHEIEVDNILIGLYEDSTAQLRKCKVNAKWKKGKSSGNGSSSSSSTKVAFPSAIITSLTPGKIVLEQTIQFINIDEELIITKQPYEVDGRWYIGIDNKVLKKLEGAEINELTNWVCPEVEQESEF